MRHILFSCRSPKYIDEQPQPCLGCRQDGTHQKRPLKKVLRQSVIPHPVFERIIRMSLRTGNDKPVFCLLLDQPEIQEEQITEIDHHPLDIPSQGQMPESCCPAIQSTDRTIKKKGQKFSETDPKPVRTFFCRGRRLFRRLDDGGGITREHQPGTIQCCQPGKQVKVSCHSEPI